MQLIVRENTDILEVLTRLALIGLRSVWKI
jgi:hypothetical protein